LEEVNRYLRSQIEQRELAEAEVQQMQRLDAIGQITSGVAHDFNNLLSVVLTNARLLSRKVNDPDDQEGIELIRAAAERGVTLTGQLLAFSRKQRLMPEPLDLNRKILELETLLNVTLGGTFKLEMDLAGDLGPALVDPTQIELLVLNLAINARDAMPSGGTLTLETFNAVIETRPVRLEDPPPGDYVVLAVKDTGSGIPNELLPRVFEPFFTTKEPGKGSGLGLAQVFGFAKQSGGGVCIDTRVGEGSSVKVFFPRSDREGSIGERASAAIESRPQAPHKLHILVVDDDRPVLRSVLRLLDNLGHSVVPADSGKAALHVVETDSDLDLVLADIAMPDMSGAELAKAIDAVRPRLPVVLMIGYGGREILRERGQMPVLQKPFSENDLAAKIAEILKDGVPPLGRSTSDPCG
jgi:nitrogen-specific signal transduction histidine kinase/CheY-like chemotaxis protein